MRGKGIHYDTGTRMPDGWTRETFDLGTVRRELQVIGDELHCTAVRLTGSDPARLAAAGELAAAAGLEVWLSPFPCDLTTDQLLRLFVECADHAEALRKQGADVTLVTGGELSLFDRGFLPGDDFFARLALFAERGPDLPSLLQAVPGKLNAFLGDTAATIRPRFKGRLTYASLPFEQVDWTPFDVVSADAYRAAHNASSFREEVRALHRHGLPVAVTEFGCCTYRGAADLGGRGFLVVDRGHDHHGPWRLAGDYERDEAGQATYLRELLQIFDEEGVDTAFWYTFAGYRYPHDPQHPDERSDLDLASYGLVQLHPDHTWKPKAAFHALADEYSRMRTDSQAATP